MSRQTKPSIVFVHGIWADGSSFSKVIPALQAEGYEVMAIWWRTRSEIVAFILVRSRGQSGIPFCES